MIWLDTNKNPTEWLWSLLLPSLEKKGEIHVLPESSKWQGHTWANTAGQMFSKRELVAHSGVAPGHTLLSLTPGAQVRCLQVAPQQIWSSHFHTQAGKRPTSSWYLWFNFNLKEIIGNVENTSNKGLDVPGPWVEEHLLMFAVDIKMAYLGTLEKFPGLPKKRS